VPIKVGGPSYGTALGNESILNHVFCIQKYVYRKHAEPFLWHIPPWDYTLTWTWITHLTFSVSNSTTFQKEVVFSCTYLLLYNLDTQVKWEQKLVPLKQPLACISVNKGEILCKTFNKCNIKCKYSEVSWK